MITALYRRNIKPGTEYNDLIPSSQCESQFRGDGDTYHSMDLIKEFIEDYSYQVAKLAPLLRGSSLKKTVANIYEFLYWHLQYKADGAAQEIRSPQCAWHSRNRGLDCKSFSVFAGAILKELKIPFSIRKIQQQGDTDGAFSHVYIIVHQPNIKPHLVIDATKHENTESNYIKKYDIDMKHYGLNASVIEKQIDCAFHDYFGRICNNLIDQGATKKSVAIMQQQVNEHIKKYGGYPYLTVNVDTVTIDTKPYSFRNEQGSLILVATKGLNGDSKAIDKAGVVLKDSIKGAVPKIKAKVKKALSDLWNKIKCKLSKGAWRDWHVKEYRELSERYFFQILDKFDNSPDSYFVPDSNGKSQFTRDFDYHILEFWSEVAKLQFELDTYANRTCSRDRLRGAIQTSEELFRGIQELYAEVSEVYPFDSYLTVRSPLMNFKYSNDFWDFDQTLAKARDRGHNDPIPQIQLPQIVVNLEKINKMYSPRPDYDFIEGGKNIADSFETLRPNKPSDPPKSSNPGGTGNSFQKAEPSLPGVINPQQQQQAGFGLLPALLIAAAGYGIYQSQNKNKTKKK